MNYDIVGQLSANKNHNEHGKIKENANFHVFTLFFIEDQTKAKTTSTMKTQTNRMNILVAFCEASLI